MHIAYIGTDSSQDPFRDARVCMCNIHIKQNMASTGHNQLQAALIPRP